MSPGVHKMLRALVGQYRATACHRNFQPQLNPQRNFPKRLSRLRAQFSEPAGTRTSNLLSCFLQISLGAQKLLQIGAVAGSCFGSGQDCSRSPLGMAVGFRQSWGGSASTQPYHGTPCAVRPQIISRYSALCRITVGRQEGRVLPSVGCHKQWFDVEKCPLCRAFSEIWPVMPIALWDQSSTSGRAKEKPLSKAWRC